jgi:hypothetical protein
MSESRGRVVNISAFYSVGRGLKSRPVDRLYLVRFLMVTLSPSKQMLG